MSQQYDKVIGFLKQLDGIQARRKALEADTTAIYREAATSGIDVLALKATNNCRHSCVNNDAVFSVYRTFTKNLNRGSYKAKRAERQSGSQEQLNQKASAHV
jgi:uncharacterized protein (UPF0335 family)